MSVVRRSFHEGQKKFIYCSDQTGLASYCAKGKTLAPQFHNSGSRERGYGESVNALFNM